MLELDRIVESQSILDVFDLDRCKLVEAPKEMCGHRGYLMAGKDYVKCSRCGGHWSHLALRE